MAEIKTLKSKGAGSKPVAAPPPKRPVLTTYYRDEGDGHLHLLRVNQSVHCNTAVKNCVHHMQLNHYGATVAEVFDTRDGVLHGVVTHNVVGEINILFHREVKENM